MYIRNLKMTLHLGSGSDAFSLALSFSVFKSPLLVHVYFKIEEQKIVGSILQSTYPILWYLNFLKVGTFS